MTCQNCFQQGHNKNGCTNQRRQPPKKAARNVGRQRKDSGGPNSGGNNNGGNNNGGGGPSGNNGGGLAGDGGGGAGGQSTGVQTRGGQSKGGSKGGQSKGGQTRGQTRGGKKHAVEQSNDAGNEAGPSNVGQVGDGSRKRKSANDGGLNDPAKTVVNEAGSTDSTLSQQVDWSRDPNVDSSQVFLGGTNPTSRGGVVVGVSSASGGRKYKGPPNSMPVWWGAGVCTDPVTGEQFIGSKAGIPLPIGPKQLPKPNPSEAQPAAAMSTLVGRNDPSKSKDKQVVESVDTVVRSVTPAKATPKKLQKYKNLPKRMPSQRIVRRKLSTQYDGPGSTYETALVLEELDGE